MNTRKYRWILYFISATILVTIMVQLYWNYQNYQLNKQRVVNDVQISLDNAIEQYYSDIAKNDFLTIIESRDDHFTFDQHQDSLSISDSVKSGFTTSLTLRHLDKKFNEINPQMDSIFKNIHQRLSTNFKGNDSIEFDSISGFTQWASNGKGYTINRPNSMKKIQMIKGKASYDSLKLFTSLKPILIAFERDSLEYNKIDSLITSQFEQKNINLNYNLEHYKGEKFYHQTNDKLKTDQLPFVNAISTYLKSKESIKLYYQNPFSEAFKRSISGILISLFLSLAIIACLFYLLKIIKNQKQLAEVKNDLISNITHEFKTPIATIGVALESIKDFKVIDNKAKTENYLDISNQQLVKLNTMVEKLLETASLDSENLALNKSDIDLISLVLSLVDKHTLHKGGKTISFNTNLSNLSIKSDPYHIENAINNILDNAVKYGGEKISIDLRKDENNIELHIADNGDGLSPLHSAKIFEKFYRVSKGNTHDVKGFGIGLYYTKKIIEKHGGQILLDLSGKSTIFKITLPIE